LTAHANQNFAVRVENLDRDTEYDMYCHARDRGTETDGVADPAGNPGNDVTFAHVLTTKRDIHTMGDSTPPTLVGVTPVHQATNIGLNPVLEMEFNEDVQANLGNLNVESDTGIMIALDISKANDGSCVNNAAKLRTIGNTFKADFSSCVINSLQPTMRYYVSFAAGVLQDNSYAKNQAPAFGLAQSYYFTTGS